MGKSHYEKDLYRQLEEVYAKLEASEKKYKERELALEREVSSLKDQLQEQKKYYEERIAKLEDGIRLRDEIIAKQQEEIDRLKSIINKDSSNSSLPPSSDAISNAAGGKAGKDGKDGNDGKSDKAKKANEYNSRRKSGRKQGGQPGHEGKNLSVAEIKKMIEDGSCEYTVRKIGRVSQDYITRYVVDCKVVPVVTEIRIYKNKGRYDIPSGMNTEVVYGHHLKAMTVMLYGVGVVSNERICEFISSITHNKIHIAAGTAYNFCRSFAALSQKKLGEIREQLMNAKMLYTDATVMTVNGRQGYIRNFSTENVVLYNFTEKKTYDALNHGPILPQYVGVLVHDHETTLYRFGTGHAECNVHLLRYLKKNTQDTNHTWSQAMSSLLCDMNEMRKQVVAEGRHCFSAAEVAQAEQNYDDILSQGRSENQTLNSRYFAREEKALLNRLAKYKANHLLFLRNFDVPFSNNLSERDLRQCKNRQKMAGGFRTAEGAAMFCAIMSVIETAKKMGGFAFEAIVNLMGEA